MNGTAPITVVPDTLRPTPGTVALRAMLWVVLVVGLAGNAVTSFTGTAGLVPHAVFGGLSLLAVVGLVVLFRRARR